VAPGNLFASRTAEERMAAQHFEEYAADRVEVGAEVGPLALPLLRGHVGRGAALPDAGSAGGRMGGGSLRLHQRQAEVGDLCPVRPSDEDVLGFQVAVHQPGPLALGVIESAAEVDCKVERLAQAERAVAQPAAQVSAARVMAGNPFEDQEGLVFEYLQSGASHDVRVILQRHPGCRLALEKPADLEVRQIAALERLERKGSAVRDTHAEVDLAHSAQLYLMNLEEAAQRIPWFESAGGFHESARGF
jgi:hypothetical protein